MFVALTTGSMEEGVTNHAAASTREVRG